METPSTMKIVSGQITLIRVPNPRIGGVYTLLSNPSMFFKVEKKLYNKRVIIELEDEYRNKLIRNIDPDKIWMYVLTTPTFSYFLREGEIKALGFDKAVGERRKVAFQYDQIAIFATENLV